MNFKRSLQFITVVMIIFLTGCGSSKNASYSKSGLYFDTLVSIEIYGADNETAERILDDCMDICSHYENLFDKNIPSGDIAKINKASGEPVRVDHDTALMLRQALNYSEISGGLFDITIGPVSDLWDFHEDTGSIPDDRMIRTACSLVGYKKLSVNTSDDTVSLTGGGSIDAGAVAKGFIADRIYDHLCTCPVTGAVINMGGDIRLLGSKADGEAYTIGINDPFNKGNVMTALLISQGSVATSGIYERCFTSENKLYHHILDPRTGYPADTDIESVTVITDTALSADCICTVCILLGSDKAMQFIESTENTEAVIVLTDKTVLRSSGAETYIIQ